MPKYKSQQQCQILSELNILLAALIIAFLAQMLQISAKSTAQFTSNSRLKNARIPRRKPFLNPAERLKRLHWAKKHVNRTCEQWKKGQSSAGTECAAFVTDLVHNCHNKASLKCNGEGLHV